MSKFFSLLVLSSVIILAGSGCSTNTKKQNNLNIKNNNWGEQRGDFASSTAPNNRIQASLNDLTIGKEVMITGSSNGNGSITATEIMIGDFKNFASSTRPNLNKGSSSQPIGETGVVSDRSMDRQRFDGNFTPPISSGSEGSIGPNSRASSGLGVASQVRFVGEIIKKDATSLVIKIANRGSQIVYYTEKTLVYLMDKSLQPPAEKPVNTSSTEALEAPKQ